MPTQQIINVGTAPNDGLGDPLRTAFQKTNDNFTALFATGGITGITNGNSAVSIPAINGNVTLMVNNSNVVTVSASAVTATVNIAAPRIQATQAMQTAVYANNAARDAAIASPVAGMIVLDSGNSQFQGYTGSTWVALN